MLQIKNIRKKYVTGSLVQTALDDVSLNLRDNEFVAILGPSGSGKTTLLNIIGGLDRYDSGDLIINGISTKKYSDRDWDSYRNHTVGFIFQSYNLIPHQTVLANVELALTISGISPRERKKRAKEALEKVGLGAQIHKKPNQMSGGQMQRVAIARALVNNPDILLADEPTGALDSDTSIQVMELLKEVSQDRLVVMVTHNPELAEGYANRIVRVRDGKIIDDTNPYQLSEDEMEPPQHKNMGKASMSFLTALSLSFNNLWTKKARTILTSFAGSIGIIGIALILSLSTGFQNYIDKIQEDTLSTYPLTIQSETADMASMLTAFSNVGESMQDIPEGVVREQQLITEMFAQVGTNDLGSFKSYLDSHIDEIDGAVNAIKYSYNISPLIYSSDTSKGLVKVNPGSLFGAMMGSSMNDSMMGAYMDSGLFQEMIPNRELLESQYDVLAGKWPESFDEMILVLSDPNSISDFTTYTLGLRDQQELTDMITQIMSGNSVESVSEQMEWTYDELLDLSFRLVLATDTYRFNTEYNVWEDMSSDEKFMTSLLNNSPELHIVGIVSPKSGVSASAMAMGVAYTPALTEYIMSASESAEIVAAQLSDSDVDVFTGHRFDEETDDSALDFGSMISVDGDMISSAFGIKLSEKQISDMMQQYFDQLTSSVTANTAPAQEAFTSLISTLCRGMLNSYISANADPSTGKAVIHVTDAEAIADSYLASDEAAALITALEQRYKQEAGSVAQVCRPLLMGLVAQCTTSGADNIAPAPSVSGSDVSGSDAGGFDISSLFCEMSAGEVDSVTSDYVNSALVSGVVSAMAARLTSADIEQDITTQFTEFASNFASSFAGSISVDGDKLAAAFNFDLTEDELSRLMQAFSNSGTKRTADSNLRTLGYSDRSNPTSISIYLVDFAGKERFISFIDNYNAQMEAAGNEDMVIAYTDMTGVLMSSVKTIVDSVSYVLIAFVAVSLVVSSIMIGIITYISVIERTKEIGVLRAIGASKSNISQVFNAETFIIGLCAGLIGVGVTLLLIPIINAIIHSLIGSADINASLPAAGAIVLVILSMVLTIIGGLIPSSKAANKDPVIALRSE